MAAGGSPNEVTKSVGRWLIANTDRHLRLLGVLQGHDLEGGAAQLSDYLRDALAAGEGGLCTVLRAPGVHTAGSDGAGGHSQLAAVDTSYLTWYLRVAPPVT